MFELFGARFSTMLANGMVVLGALTAVEMLLSRSNSSLRSRLRGAGFWIVNWVFAALIAVALIPVWRALHVQPLLTLEIGRWYRWAGPLAGLCIALTVILATDFFGYWFHRLQHGPLWRFHAVHHSIRDVNAVNSYGHVADSLFQAFFMGLPMSLIPFGPYDAPIYLTVFLMFQTVAIHSPLRFGYGPLGILFADCRYHRIHHSLNPRHFSRNYGTMTTVWDRLFGTAHFPAKDEWPEAGLADMPEPRGLREYLDLPLRYGRRQPSQTASAPLKD